ncbi:hypothetical protein H7K28_16305 [Paenibacillus polymyxa]|uniref:hypothetical protein n=1 Tax=Paenibacillus polymyxa TaxID=1406 RepID=UPI0015802F58|nr:hypothetical protein [Paenibacillus polymyxa]MBY0023464.1 hypothetical protein [Paenibacillus polymyxa]MBY0056137.1 hypothetical protein [Paenibacillus polymyxa]MBY0071484.1 hypothetical protein [Paenibacillus polymyxa]MBY0080950.1 hypothetical protein [Paenibacillus polymyxa]MBZ6442886.1 hypothetical protein [Paenibacillus polymyxa]
MVQTISKLLGALLAVLLLYIVPAAQAAERQDDISGLNTYHSTVHFVDMVRTKGYITPTMYNDFIRDLELTGNTYEVHLEHMHKKYVPNYADAAKPDSFLGNYEVVYDSYYNPQILPVLFPDHSQPKSEQIRRYTLMAGDYFTVRLYNTNRTPADLYKSWLLGGIDNDNPAVSASYGGMVLNEDY